MGFCMTETLQERRDPPAKNRVVGSRPLAANRVEQNDPQPLETVSETSVTITVTVSGLSCWPSRDPIENLSPSTSSAVSSILEERVIERARRQLFAEGLPLQDVEGILGVLRRMLRESPQHAGGSLDPSLMSGELDNLYRFCANDPINSYDFLGLESKDEKYQKLINAAKAAWEAAKYAVPGSEFPAALEAFGGCNTLGLINAWADKKYKECLCDKGFDDPECEKWKSTKDWLTGIWNKECNK